MSSTKVVNIHKKEEYDVYIGRAGKGQDGYYGNPIPLGPAGRDACVAEYRTYFYNRIATDLEFKESIEGLRGKRLGCFCYPKCCHGMVIVEYLDGVSVADQLAEIEEGTLRNVPSLFDEFTSNENE
jgi:hypothetical protein